MEYDLEKIESFAFSNMESFADASNIDDVRTGLTKLILPKNDKLLFLEKGVFDKADLEELTTYTNLIVPAEYIMNDPDANGNLLAYIGPFAFSNIAVLNISLGLTIDWLIAPILHILQFIGWPAEFKLIMQTRGDD